MDMVKDKLIECLRPAQISCLSSFQNNAEPLIRNLSLTETIFNKFNSSSPSRKVHILGANRILIFRARSHHHTSQKKKQLDLSKESQRIHHWSKSL